GGPPLVRGNVYRIKDEFNTGNDTVVVTTSYTALDVPLPNPRPRAQHISQDPFELYTRACELVLIALAGRAVNGQLSVHAMGFRPFVYTEASSGLPCTDVSMCEADEVCQKDDEDDLLGVCMRIYENHDIVIDTPLIQPLHIQLDDPPSSVPG